MILSSKWNCFPSLVRKLKKYKSMSYSVLSPQHWSSCLAYRKPTPKKSWIYWITASQFTEQEMEVQRENGLLQGHRIIRGRAAAMLRSLSILRARCSRYYLLLWTWPAAHKGKSWPGGREGKQAIPGRRVQLLELRQWLTDKQGNRKEVKHRNAPERLEQKAESGEQKLRTVWGVKIKRQENKQ